MPVAKNAGAVEEATPEFVRWTIGRDCALREDYAWTDPEQTERLLRPVRAVGDAQREGRMVGGVALEQAAPILGPLAEVRGFLVSETLSAFGGEAQVIAACAGCPANVLPHGQARLAGCFGMFYLADAPAFHRALEATVKSCGLDGALATAFPPTRPRWYGFWFAESLCGEQRRLLLSLRGRREGDLASCAPGWEEWMTALATSLAAGLPLYARLIPAGYLQDGVWKLGSHCKRCRAPRLAADRTCAVCGAVGDVCAGRSRKMRGSRPYYPLARQLGAARLQELVDAYNAKANAIDHSR